MIYFIEAVGVGNIKIGFTDKDDALERLAELQVGSPVPLRLLGVMPGTMEGEKDLHRRFASARVLGEWFKPVSELLALVPTGETRVNGPAEVVVKSVQIKVLTVGRKQFTKSLLSQIPYAHLFDHKGLWADLIGAAGADDPGRRERLEAAAVLVDLNTLPGCDYWGWVDDGEKRWLLHESGGVLSASVCLKPDPPFGLLMEPSRYNPSDRTLNWRLWEAYQAALPLNEAVRAVWARHAERYVSEQHHLYIGV